MIAKPWSQLTTDELYAVLKLRTDVFFLEQRIEEEELDHRDREPAAMHYWIADDTGVSAYLRVLRDAEPEHIDAHLIVGRVVVRADRRGEGLAQQLVERAIEDSVGQAMLLHSQQYIAPLYAKCGFEPFGDVFMEAGIAHISMYRPGVTS